jgi:putative flippase GtrA
MAANSTLLRQVWYFGVVGTVGFVVNAALVEALVNVAGVVWAQAIAFPVAVTVTWWLNRKYTFGASKHAVQYELLRYVLANSLGWVANNGVYVALVLTLPFARIHPAIAVAGGTAAGVAFNFCMTRSFVFRQGDTTRDFLDS